jgi:GH24 family phage-related lysozyme (muramidase)
MMAPLSDNAKKLIFDFEGLDEPCDWPGGASGVTIGIGYDLGYVTHDEFLGDWKPCLGDEECEALAAAIGLKGETAKEHAATLKSIRIKESDAQTVFLERSVPNYQAQTEQAFPGVDKLPPDAQGALFSLVYNRGTRMTDSNPETQDRREMRAIRDAVAKGDLDEIANQLRSMKRLWEGKNMGGLLRRRDAEADLVESSIQSLPA